MSTLKRCHFTNLNNEHKCGCLRYVLKSTPDDDGFCKGCGHHQSFHEEDDDDGLCKGCRHHQSFHKDDDDILQNNLQKINEVKLNNKHSQYNTVPIPAQ